MLFMVIERTAMPSLVSMKTVLRCRDFEASRKFYHSILGLQILEEWNEPVGQGAIFGFGPHQSGSLEIFQMTRIDPRYDPVFMSQIANDKIDVQLRTDSLESWVDKLHGSWPVNGPEDLPWGQRWIKLRDPDGLLIAIYENTRDREQGAA